MKAIVVGPIPEKWDGGERLVCCTKHEACIHYRMYDWQYNYCAAFPDEYPQYRKGGGKYNQGNGPLMGCPFSMIDEEKQ